jgi:hypothetical protein
LELFMVLSQIGEGQSILEQTIPLAACRLVSSSPSICGPGSR